MGKVLGRRHDLGAGRVNDGTGRCVRLTRVMHDETIEGLFQGIFELSAFGRKQKLGAGVVGGELRLLQECIQLDEVEDVRVGVLGTD